MLAYNNSFIILWIFNGENIIFTKSAPKMVKFQKKKNTLFFSTSRGGGPDPKIGIFKSEGGGVIEVHFPLFPRNDLNIYW